MNSPVRLDKFRVAGSKPEPGIYKLTHLDAREDATVLPTIPFINRQLINQTTPSIEWQASDGILVELSSIPGSIIQDGDIVQVSDNGAFRVILSKRANSNTVLFTENCDNLCKFCSQPPKTAADEWLVGRAALSIIEFSSDTVIGVSGGEPLLHKERFISFLNTLTKFENNTPLHVLTNGRALSDVRYAERLANTVAGRDFVLGVPVYGIKPETHDRIVQSSGAWEQTIQGLINASRFGLRVELRIIPTLLNLCEVPLIIDQLGKTVPAIEQFSIMNLEPQGWARNNWDELFVAQSEQCDALKIAVETTSRLGITTLLFNYQLCQLEADLRPYSVQSISDWKNYYPKECKSCQLKSACTGFFTSSKSKFIEPPRPVHEEH